MLAKKKYAAVFTVFMFLTSLAMVSVPVQSQSPTTFYVHQPLGHIEAKPAGTTFWVDIYVSASDLVYESPEAIVGWGIYVQVNASVLKPLRVKTSIPGYFLWNFSDTMWPEPLPYPKTNSYVDSAAGLVDVSEQISPSPSVGAATDDPWGLLPDPCLLVSVEFESLSLYDDTVIDIVSPEYMDTYGNWTAVVDGDGYYQGWERIPVGANLVGKKAWPEHRHFDLSKSGNSSIPDSHGTPGVQTLYAKIKNVGDLTVPVRAIFRLVRGGVPEAMVVSNEVLLDSGDLVIVQGDAREFEAGDIGKWYIEARCEYYFADVWNTGETTKITAFNIVA